MFKRLGEMILEVITDLIKFVKLVCEVFIGSLYILFSFVIEIAVFTFQCFMVALPFIIIIWIIKLFI